MRGRDLKILFMGTPGFAVPSLRALVENGYNVTGVVTAPDKPCGRGLKIGASDVKIYAQSAGLPVLQPEKLRDEGFLAAIREMEPDLGIVIAFRMLPQEVWSMPRLGTFNLHASLLPQYRGAAPINWAIINGEKTTGVTTFMLDSQIDTGDILAQMQTEILPHDNAGTLHDRLMNMGCQLVLNTVEDIAAGRHSRTGQSLAPESELKPAPKIFKDDCRIDWDAEPQNIVNLIRGLAPHPAAWSILHTGSEDVSVKIFEATACDRHSQCSLPAGTIISDGRTSLEVVCRSGTVRIEEMQMAGKRRMTARDWLCGVKNIEQYKF